jgi:type IV pilus assembly protein PilY1
MSSNIWVYFGTGRFYTADDKTPCLVECQTPGATCDDCQYASRRWFYGAKEPRDNQGRFNWNAVTPADLIDTSTYDVYEDGYVNTDGDATHDMHFSELISQVADAGGWRIKFDEVGERSFSQANLFGGIVLFTTYVPSGDICEFEGHSNLYALYYLTGTAYSGNVIGLGDVAPWSDPEDPDKPQQVLGKINLGAGIGTAPSIHVGADSKFNVQTSTGSIFQGELNPAQEVKSGMKAWQEEY